MWIKIGIFGKLRIQKGRRAKSRKGKCVVVVLSELVCVLKEGKNVVYVSGYGVNKHHVTRDALRSQIYASS